MGNSHPNNIKYSPHSFDSRFANGIRLDRHNIATDRPQKYRVDEAFKSHSNTDIHKIVNSYEERVPRLLQPNGAKFQNLGRQEQTSDQSSDRIAFPKPNGNGHESPAGYKNPKYFSLNLDAMYRPSPFATTPSSVYNSSWQILGPQQGYYKYTDDDTDNSAKPSPTPFESPPSYSSDITDRKGRGRSIFFGKKRRNKTEQPQGADKAWNKAQFKGDDTIGRRPNSKIPIKPPLVKPIIKAKQPAAPYTDLNGSREKKVFTSRLSYDHGTQAKTQYSSQNSDTDQGGIYNVSRDLYPSFSSPFYTSDSNYASEDASSAKISLSKSFVFSRDPYRENCSKQGSHSLTPLIDSQLSSFRKVISPTNFDPFTSNVAACHGTIDPGRREGGGEMMLLHPKAIMGVNARQKMAKETQWKMFAKFVEPAEGTNTEDAEKDKPRIWLDENKRIKRKTTLGNGRCKRSQSAFSLYKLVLNSKLEDDDEQMRKTQCAKEVKYEPLRKSYENAKSDIAKCRSFQNLAYKRGEEDLNVVVRTAAAAAAKMASNSLNVKGNDHLNQTLSPAPSDDSGRSSNSTLGDTLSSKVSRQGSSPLSDIMEFEEEKEKSKWRRDLKNGSGQNVIIEAYPAVVTHNYCREEKVKSPPEPPHLNVGSKMELTSLYDSGKADSVPVLEKEINEWTIDVRKKPNEDTGYSSHSEDNNECKRTRAQHIFTQTYRAEVPLRYGSPFHPTQPTSHLKYPKTQYQSKNSNPDLSRVRATRQREDGLSSKSYDNIYFVRNGNWILKKEKLRHKPQTPASDWDEKNQVLFSKELKLGDRNDRLMMSGSRNESSPIRSKRGACKAQAGEWSDEVVSDDGSESASSVTSNFINNQFSYLYNSDIYEDIEDIRSKGWQQRMPPLPKYANNNHNNKGKLSSAISYDRIARPGSGSLYGPKGQACRREYAPVNPCYNGESRGINRLGAPLLSGSQYLGAPYETTPTEAHSYVINDMEAYIQNQRRLDKVLIQENWRNRSQPCLANDHLKLITDHRSASHQDQREVFLGSAHTLDREEVNMRLPIAMQSRDVPHWLPVPLESDCEILNSGGRRKQHIGRDLLSRRGPNNCNPFGDHPHIDTSYLMVPNVNYVFYKNNGTDFDYRPRVSHNLQPIPQAYPLGGGGGVKDRFRSKAYEVGVSPSPKPGWNLNRRGGPKGKAVFKPNQQMVHDRPLKDNYLPLQTTHISPNYNAAAVHFVKRPQQNLNNCQNQTQFTHNPDRVAVNYEPSESLVFGYCGEKQEALELIPRIKMTNLKGVVDQPALYQLMPPRLHYNDWNVVSKVEEEGIPNSHHHHTPPNNQNFHQIMAKRPKSFHTNCDGNNNVTNDTSRNRMQLQPLPNNDRRYVDSWGSEAYLTGLPMIPKEIRNNCLKKAADLSRVPLMKREVENKIKQNGSTPVSQSIYSMENIDYPTDTTTKISHNQSLLKNDACSSKASKIKKFQSDENLKVMTKCQIIREEIPQGGNFWKRMSWLEKSTAQQQVVMKNRPLPKEPRIKKDKDNMRMKK